MLATIFLLLFIAAVVSSLFSIHSIRSNFETFESTSNFTTKIDSIENDINLVRQNVLSFAFTGNESAADQARERADQVSESIEQVVSMSDDEEVDYHLTKMRIHLETYLSNFDTVEAERKIRNDLVQKGIVDESAKIQSCLDEIQSAKTEDSYSIGSVDLNVIKQNVLLAEVSALRFLDDPDSTQVREVQSRLAQAIKTISESGTGQPLQEKEIKLVELLESFEQNFLRTVQATRGYLYLVNVVMAGEAVEFSYQSRRINEISKKRLATIAQQTSNSTRLASNVALVSAVTAIAISILVSVAMVRMIVVPIGHITNTLSALSRDERIDQIPGIDRRDEIGDMAKAANVFREKNLQTENLLEETRVLAEKLDVQAKQLAQSNEELDSFAYVASHDLKSPLRAIDNLSKWIHADANDVLPEESCEHLQEMRKRVKRMDQLLNDLLTYSRAKQRGSDVEEIDIAKLVCESRDLINWPDDMQLDIAPELPVMNSLRLPLERIFQNLMTNATKYRREANAQVEISSRDLGREFEFSVADNGPGIAPEFHTKIFEMFKRLHRQNEVDGSGMGLALVKRLVESMGGTIRVQSDEGQGACFIFTVPKELPEL